MSLENLNSNLQTIETSLNRLGYVPVVSTFSACARYAYGKVELMTALAVAAISFVGSVFEQNQDRRSNLEARSIKAIEYAIHGWLNMGRAILEFIPFISLATCLPYDLAGKKILVYTNQ